MIFMCGYYMVKMVHGMVYVGIGIDFDSNQHSTYTVQGHRLVELKFQWSLFAEFLQADFLLLKIRSWLPIKINEFKKAMVKKYFQNSNILLNKLLQWNKVSQNGQ